MEEVYQNSSYKSAWKPLIRENNLSVTTSVLSDAEISEETVKTPAAANKTPGLDEALKKLNEISADLNTLNQIVLEQGEKIDSLLSLLEEKENEGRKNIFGLLRK